ncbi:gas vesicle protein GvpO [Halococcus saccharolyticus]|uniref:Gas vesicle synthesis family protein n=1 Tax=Halococcus saccharolyticus DSM 5350 TaxID=1227455 RepID=M0MLL0_9EURY|nr:gas vesicle protein GvpO [Halococcus saccharolyticus]EMA46531.1 gas vesicle synthesis family protein [Halococcus saccharolyticus DSM 5350]
MADLDPSDHTIDELEAQLDEIDDPETLQEIRDAETDGEDRTGALDAIDERLNSVTDDGADSSDESGNDTDAGSSDDGTSGNGLGIIDIRNQVRDVAADLIGRPLDGITEVRADDDGWYSTVEVIERNSIPDTQDILGRYEIDLDADGNVRGYRRLRRYRRGDTNDETLE